MRDFVRLLAFATALAVAAPPRARGQGAEFGATKAKKPKASDDSGNAEEGLQSATPTDNVNELNSNGAPTPPKNANGNVEDFPASDDAKSFDIGNSGNGNGAGANGVFDNKAPPADNPKAANAGANSAFGPSAANAAKAAAKAGAAAPANANPAAANVPNTVTATPSPNANALLNQANSAGQAPPPAAPPPQNVNATPAATGQEELTPPPPPGPPPTVAPPLPPPNEFSGAPPVPGTMRLMAEGEAPEEYLVQPGDTLFDICDQLLDEAGYWPKLWALNPEIKNPHFIFPNMRLRFYPGDDDNPPYLQVVTEDDVIPIDKGDLDEGDLIAEKVIFQQDEAADSKSIEVIGPEQVDALEDQILSGGKLYSGSDVQVHVPGFIYGDEKDPVGYVIGGRDGGVSLPPDALALVESAGSLAVGTLYTVLRKGERVKNPETGDNVGYKYYFVADVHIERKIGDDVFIAKIRDSRLSVMPDDILVNFISTKRSVPLGTNISSLSSAAAHVVGFEYDKQEIGGHANFAFIDKGTGDGISPGMYLPIYATPGDTTSAFTTPNLPIDYELVGVIRIIDTTDAGSVGYIVRNKLELRIGDRTNKG